MLFKDLDENVQDRLIAEYHDKQTADFWWFYDDEIKYAWEAIAKELGATLDYEYSLCSYSYTKLDDIDYDILALEGKRAYAYIYTHWIEPHIDYKTFSKHGKCRKSNIIRTWWGLPYTGTTCDNVMWEAWKDYVERFNLPKLWKKQMTVAYFIEILEAHMIKYVLDEADYYSSDECAIDYLSEHDYDEEGNEIA